MPLKQVDIVFYIMTLLSYNDNIDNIHYKLGLNIYIGRYIIVLLTIGVNPCVKYCQKSIINDDTMAIQESWLVSFLISFFGNL